MCLNRIVIQWPSAHLSISLPVLPEADFRTFLFGVLVTWAIYTRLASCEFKFFGVVRGQIQTAD